MNNRLIKQIEFIATIDSLKTILRKTSPLNSKRKENSAEHSWQVALTAIILAEYSNENIDLMRVIKMLLVHDIVEIDAGDVCHYDKDGTETEKEVKAAERLFGFLPEDQRTELFEIWKEFEIKKSPEARFATAIDRLIPILLNAYSEGGSWKELGITSQQVTKKNQDIQNGSHSLWNFTQQLIQESIEKGFLSHS